MKKALKHGLNLHLMRASNIEEIGSLLQHFAELLVGHSFSSIGHQKENQRILEPSLGHEQAIIALLSSISPFRNTSLLANIPIAEIPMFLSPRESFDSWRSKTLSQREKVTFFLFDQPMLIIFLFLKNSLRVFEAHEKLFKAKQHELGRYPYSFSVNRSRVENSILSILKSTGFSNELKKFENTILELPKPETYIFEITQDFGMDVISQAFKDQVYGKMLRSDRSTVLAVMRFSQIIGEAGTGKALENLFLDKFSMVLKGLGASHQMVDHSRQNHGNFK